MGKDSEGMQSENETRTRLRVRDEGEDDEDEDYWHEARARREQGRRGRLGDSRETTRDWGENSAKGIWH